MEDFKVSVNDLIERLKKKLGEKEYQITMMELQIEHLNAELKKHEKENGED